ncbi:MAG TPA: hypothetical protein VJ464_17640, partial [Blastocatellia bacterium]|nr:hypothetical protein [Blastocatellia bacterium]
MMSSDLAKKQPLYAVRSDAALESSGEQRHSEEVAKPADLCSACSGTGWEFVEGKGVRPCRCRTQERRAKLLADACIPKLYSETSLQTYQPAKGNLSQLRAFNYAHTLVRDYPVVERGILLMGSVGVGKT